MKEITVLLLASYEKVAVRLLEDLNIMNIVNGSMRIEPEVFYLIGALRDGCLTTQWTIKYAQKYKVWLEDTIMPLINKNFNAKLKDNCIYYQDGKWPYWYIAVSNKKLWRQLSLIKGIGPRSLKEWKYYIRGFWDADGGCPRFPDINKKIYIKFTQKDEESLHELKDVLTKRFGIKSGNVRISEHKKSGSIWRFSITNKKGMIDFCRLVGSSHQIKKVRLKTIENLLSAR